MLKKPIKKHRNEPTYDFNECTEYIEKKYNIKHRDYAGKFSDGKVKDVPYQDYWHFVLDKYDDIRNDYYFDMEISYMREDAEDWQNKITDLFEKEFADENGIIQFHVWW